MSETKSVRINGEQIPYTLTRKRVKNITIRIKENGEIAVTCPTRTAIARIEEIIRDKMDFIRAGQEKMAKKRRSNPPFE